MIYIKSILEIIDQSRRGVPIRRATGLHIFQHNTEWNPDGSYNSDGKSSSDASDVCDANFPDPSKNDSPSNSDTKVTFVENSTLEKGSDQKGASYTSFTSLSPKISESYSNQYQAKKTNPKIMYPNLFQIFHLQQLKPNTLRLYNTDLFGCRDCNIKGDKYAMENHVCSGFLKKKSSSKSDADYES